MIFYTYDEKTKEFTGTQNAFIDPLETKKHGKNVYLVPANATDKKPLEVKENQAVIFNGSEWEIIADYRGKTYYIGTEQHEMKELGDLPKGATFEPVEPEKTLDELKSEKLSELTAITSKFTVNNCDEMNITSSLGYAINADKTAQDNIRGLIEAHGESDIIKYKIYDNSFKEVTIADLKIMLKECAKNGENLYTQKFLYQEKIKACKTIKELEKITFDFVMLDFSEVT